MRRLVAAAGVLACAVLAVLLVARRPGGAAPTMPGPLEAGPARAGVPEAQPPLPAASSRPSVAAMAALAVRGPSRLSARAERMRADWCGFGAQAHELETEAFLHRVEAAGGMVGAAALAELEASDGAQVLGEARDEARGRWVQALRQRGDPRSLALAEFLGPGEGAPADAQAAARSRLQALARSASDPMVTALALLRPCAAGACVNVEPSQWSRLEPQNLQAWLALLRGSPNRHAELDYVMERMATQGEWSNTYQRDSVLMLLSLSPPGAVGLQAEAEMQFLVSMASSWPAGNFAAIMRACREPGGTPGRLERCEAIAQRLWQGEDLLQRGLALGLARAVVEAQPTRRAAWEAQALAYDAWQAWRERETELLVSPPARQAAPAGCEAQAALWRQVRDRWTLGEWTHAQRALQAAGADPALLAAAWRRQAGRSALDAVKPASAAAR